MNTKEIYLSVDVETSGPVPGDYSLLALGACRAGSKDGFYVELQPVNSAFDLKALEIVGKPLTHFSEHGKSPQEAMILFEQWISTTAAPDTPVFVGFNAAFDWSFVNYYFVKYLGRNPFGFTALDIKSYYAGLLGCPWEATRSSRISAHFKLDGNHSHNALEDAIEQGIMFTKMLEYGKQFRKC